MIKFIELLICFNNDVGLDVILGLDIFLDDKFIFLVLLESFFIFLIKN